MALLFLFAPAGQAQRFVKYVDSVQALKDLNVSDVHASVFVRGYFAAQDGGEGFFWWNASDTTATNRGTVLKGKTTGSELATGRWNRVAPANAVNVRWFGAKGDGSTDDTAAIVDAYGAISSTSGGEIFFPVGKFKFNLVVTNQNISIRGSSHFIDYTGTTTNCFVPAVNASPVIQVGNDTARLKGFSIKDVTMLGSATGSMGLYFAGGPFEATARNVSIYNFTNCVKVLGGTAQAASLIWLERLDVQAAGVDNSRGILVVQTSNYPTSWTTAIEIVDSHIQAQAAGSNAYAMETDSCGVYISNTYFDLRDGHGVKLSDNQSPIPFLYCSNVSFDSSPGTGAAIESFSNTRVFSDQISGSYTVSGKWKLLDGTLLTPPTGSLRGNALLWAPHVVGSIRLIKNGEADFTGVPYTNQQINVDSSSNMHFISQGTPIFDTGTGALQINSTPSGSQSSIIMYDSTHANYTQVLGSSGFISLLPLSGGASRLLNSAGSSMFQVNGTDGATFFFGAGINASSTPYLDSNKQIKSAPTGTATLDFPSTAAQTSSELTITATGATVGDCVILGTPASVNANTCYTARVSAADTVTVKFNNYSSAAVDPASATFKVTVLK